MRLSLRFVIPLLLALAAFAYAVVPLVDKLTLRWFVRDLDMRASLIANTVQEPMQDLLRAGNRTRMVQYFTTITQDERLFAIGFCPATAGEPLATRTLPSEVRCGELDQFLGPSGHLLTSAHGPVLVSVRSLEANGTAIGSLVLVHDMSFVARRSEETRKYVFLFFVGLGLMVALITVVIAQLSWRGWVQGLRALLRGEGLFRPSDRLDTAELRPIAGDLRTLIRDLEADHRSRDPEQLAWTPDTLRAIVRDDLRGHQVIVVSNREPYIHVHRGDEIAVRRPASGLVTALEPIMRACSGTWVAHGGGSADRTVVDNNDRVGVPPERPAYQLRRVWLSEQEEAGYYYGFANEGLWPLCHIAHVRPVFRTSDWEQYVQVNRTFAKAVVDESKSPDPIVLIQDYHFALLPRMIEEALPAATIISFWHIPWPNPEAFAICPWRDELLDGMLGSSILGFHTQFHCNNFVDTVDRLLEARVDRETFTVTYRGQPTAVKRYPISIEWPPSAALVGKPVEACRRDIRQRHGLPLDHAIGIGVDRLDYTKGIEERLRAVERLLEREPRWIGQFTFIQIAAPTRTRIGQYQDYEGRVIAMAAQINERFADETPADRAQGRAPRTPRHLRVLSRRATVHGHQLARRDESGGEGVRVRPGRRAGRPDSEPLHRRGTRAARSDYRQPLRHGSVRFGVAARSLYDPWEQRARMRVMRGLIQEFNVYRWAGRMLLDAAGMRRRGRLRERTLRSDRLLLEPSPQQ